MRKFIFLFFSGFSFYSLNAQNINTGGHLSGSFESYTQFYHKDKKINAVLPPDRIGSNNYLKLDYSFMSFSAGFQFESYLPSIAGYPYLINESKLVNKYFKYTRPRFSVQVGDFYEQFGSGLIFRSWENRQIGINNALEGANIQVQLLRGLKLKTVYGRQRKILDHANSIIRGADLEIDFSQTRSPEKISLTRVAAGLSVVNRYQQYTGPDTGIHANVNAGAARLDISGGVASLSLEYVLKGSDAHDVNLFDKSNGKAFLLNASIAKNNLGLNFIFRGMDNMDFRGERDAFGTIVPVNYIPALTRQHDYLTTNIYVYNAQSLGETGGQADLFYNFPKGKGLGGKQGANLSVNFSHYRGLKGVKILGFGGVKYFQDFNAELKKHWSEKWNTTFAYHNLFYNKSIIEGGLHENIHANIFVLNALCKYAKRKSFRFELQHLFTSQDDGNWAALVTEFGFAPVWTFFLSDLYNYDRTNIHYPNIGGSFTKGGTRLSLNYGRQRAGLFCVGGVCRYVPAATGISATLTITFNN
jgi:uncharacterized protein DUF6029